jgi:tetratricopeptide (TPR) repeat protein
MGYLDLLSGEFDRAEASLNLCLEKDDSYLRARYNLALLAWLRGDEAQALQLYKEARRSDRADVELQQHLADLDEMTERHPDANLSALKNKLAVAIKTGRLK